MKDALTIAHSKQIIMMMKYLMLFALTFILNQLVHAQEQHFKTKFDDAIPVLSVGTFHMGFTSDATRTEFNPRDPKSIQEVHDLVSKFEVFKPTVMMLEVLPEQQKNLQARYDAYLANPKMTFDHPSEIELLAFELGRRVGVKKVYGIDYAEGYNYNVYQELNVKVDSLTIPRYGELIRQNEANYLKHLNRKPNVIDMFRVNNSAEYLDFLININADMLLYASSPAGQEGAEEAAKFYHRNLLMFSNLNKVPLHKNDRVFVLLGATHTAFFREWFNRSPKYKLENTLEYLK